MENQDDKKHIKEKIIYATIECIEKEGVQNLTNRKIAKEAGVNSAAINYYFGSKEHLIDEVKKITLKNIFEDKHWEAFCKLDEKNLQKDSLQNFLEHILEGVLNYPNITLFHLESLLHYKGNNDSNDPIIYHFNNFLNNFYEGIYDTVSDKKQKYLKYLVIQLWSTLIVQGLLPNFFHNFSSLDLSKNKHRKELIQSLLASLYEE